MDQRMARPMSFAGQAIAADPAMAAVLARVAQVAPSDATVLITGESGSGKEVVARHLHACSARRDGAFVALNCAAIPDALRESALFGHEAGAFEGALQRRTGRFEAAGGGTLLLDEVGEMDPPTQARLLRAVQQREIDRLGGSHPVPVDMRIVATTTRNLAEEVRAGRFRADLYFRLNVVGIQVPPLRDRPADVSVLAAHFAARFAAAHGLPGAAVSPAAMAVLQRHAWPGNVRELENAVLRGVLTETGPAILPGALDIDLATPPPAAVPNAVATSGRTIGAVEKDMILDTLCRCKGHRAQAAAVLGISIRTLRNKLHEYERAGTRIPRPVIVAVA